MDRVPLKRSLGNYDVFVMIAEIFSKALKDHSEDGLGENGIRKFSLVFFDEAHHCDKGFLLQIQQSFIFYSTLFYCYTNIFIYFDNINQL